MAYKWSHPYEWLCDAAKAWDAERLYRELLFLAEKLDGDTIQDEYQSEMANDGYFTEEE